jgi:tetratricopeptide (TPR) repeat protein
MTKQNILATVLLAFLLAGLSSNVSIASSTRDKYKTDKCYSAEGNEIPCASADQQVAKYPNATRITPEFPKSKIKSDWDALVKATQAKDPNILLAAAQRVLANPNASINEQAESANQVAQAYLQLDKTNYLKPIEYGSKALELNGLNNNTHYQLMYVLGQMLLVEKQYARSLILFDRFQKETGMEDIGLLKNRGNALYRLERYPEAVIALRKAYDLDKGADPNLATLLLDAYNKTGQKAEANKLAEEVAKATPAGDPNDKSAQVKQLLVLANAKQYEKAAKVFDELYARGQISQLNEYEAGYISYSYLEGKEAKAIAIIKDGMGKGVITPDATVYNILGQSYYYTNEPKAAAEAWGKAAALSPKGEYDLLLARVLAEESEYAKAKTAANAALSKGIASRGEAYLIIAEAESEFGLDNKTAMQAALREAMKDPETQDRASKMMKNAGLK